MKDFGEGSSTVKSAPEECEQMTLCWNVRVDLREFFAWWNDILKAYSPEQRQALDPHPATWKEIELGKKGGKR